MASTPICGADYKAFLLDDHNWLHGTYTDDVLLVIDGKPVGDSDESNVSDISDTASIIIESGDVIRRGNRLHSLQEHYDKWNQERSTVSFIVTCPKLAEQAVIAAIQAAGGTVPTSAPQAPALKAPRIIVDEQPRVIYPMNATGGLYIHLLAPDGYLTNEEIAAFCEPIAREHGWNPEGRCTVGLPTVRGITSRTYAVWIHDKLN